MFHKKIDSKHPNSLLEFPLWVLPHGCRVTGLMFKIYLNNKSTINPFSTYISFKQAFLKIPSSREISLKEFALLFHLKK